MTKGVNNRVLTAKIFSSLMFSLYKPTVVAILFVLVVCFILLGSHHSLYFRAIYGKLPLVNFQTLLSHWLIFLFLFFFSMFLFVLFNANSSLLFAEMYNV